MGAISFKLRCQRHANIPNFQKNYREHTDAVKAMGVLMGTPWGRGRRDSRVRRTCAAGLDVLRVSVDDSRSRSRVRLAIAMPETPAARKFIFGASAVFA